LFSRPSPQPISRNVAPDAVENLLDDAVLVELAIGFEALQRRVVRRSGRHLLPQRTQLRVNRELSQLTLFEHAPEGSADLAS
jgi:hypothetical protein